MAFHHELKKYRDEILGISQTEAAKRLHMTQATLSHYEHGRRQITIDILKQFQHAYEIPQDYMMQILFEEELEKTYTAQLLRERAKSLELNKILDMLERHDDLHKFLVTLSHADENTQKRLIKFLPHAYELTGR